jgi:uncharacterized protein (TIGR02284 family)
MRNAQTISTLRELIAVNNDAERGFRTCADHAHEPDIDVLLRNCASTCANNAQELHALLRQLGPTSGARGETGTATHRGWNDLRLSATDDASLLEECERCEAYTLEMYRNALDDPLPDFVRRIVLRQFIKVMRNQDRVRAYRGGDEPRPAQRAKTGS